jgi:23S rRNA pseudouridine2605 synthase
MEQNQEGIRLQKVLASAGVGSRRACEELIDEGRVAVNGIRVNEQGRRVNPAIDLITVDGDPIAAAAGFIVIALNKPSGVVTTMKQDDERPTVADYVANRSDRLFHVGRLDADTEGLILLTNDGNLAHGLTHPSSEVKKIYLARIKGTVSRTELSKLTTGVELTDGFAKADSVDIIGNTPGETAIEISIHEGRNRVIRRMCEHIGHEVIQLVRVQFGPIKIGDMKLGKTRVLNHTEVGSLYRAAQLVQDEIAL